MEEGAAGGLALALSLSQAGPSLRIGAAGWSTASGLLVGGIVWWWGSGARWAIGGHFVPCALMGDIVEKKVVS